MLNECSDPENDGTEDNAVFIYNGYIWQTYKREDGGNIKCSDLDDVFYDLIYGDDD